MRDVQASFNSSFRPSPIHPSILPSVTQDVKAGFDVHFVQEYQQIFDIAFPDEGQPNKAVAAAA